MKTNKAILIVILGALSALGPLTTDMYIPALPEMSSALETTVGMMQKSVMSYFIGLTVGQLFYGPVSDRYGRKPVIYFALIVFAISSLGCQISNTGETLVWWRFGQGLGASIGMIISIAIVRDVAIGTAAIKMMALITAILGIAPVIAPSIGAAIMLIASWRAIFIILGAVSIVLLMLVAFGLPETRDPQKAAKSEIKKAVHNYIWLMKQKNFMPYAATLAFANGAFFAYIAGSSFIMIDIYHVSPTRFAQLFALNAVGLILTIQIAAHSPNFFSLKAQARLGAAILTTTSGTALFFAIIGVLGFWPITILMFFAISAFGLILPSCNILALHHHSEISGTAAALIGSLGYGAGALASAILASFGGGSALPMLVIMFGAGVLAMLSSWRYVQE